MSWAVLGVALLVAVVYAGALLVGGLIAGSDGQLVVVVVTGVAVLAAAGWMVRRR